MQGTVWRLLEHGEADGYRNMAVDDALLQACAEGEPGFPCLRLYGFSPACLSLGFHQESSSVHLDVCRREGIDVVRRPTGGRTVLHDGEIAYAVVARHDRPPFRGGLPGACAAVADALLEGFRSLGLAAPTSGDPRAAGSPQDGEIGFVEPARREIVAGSRKIAGSALARRRGAFLQHGSLPIAPGLERLRRLVGRTGTGEGPGGGGLASAPDRPSRSGERIGALRHGFERGLDIRLGAGSLTGAEHLRAEWLRAHRYLTTEWTFRR